METTSSSPARELNQRELENAFNQLQPSSASTSAKKLPWDIFINHRPIDVKDTLASTIYHTFQRMGFRAFLDAEELQPGDAIQEQIQQAMATASLHIAIFSPRYAESPWCLAELSFMLKTGTTIIPIFYHVEPSDLRWIAQGKGMYAAAFSHHERKGRCTPQKLDEWKKALHTVAFFSGFLVNNNEDEGIVLKNIVNYVLNVTKKVPFAVAKHPVGLDGFVQEFEEAIVEYSAQTHQIVKIMGIVGMGGSGKTTLAKELFNRKFSSFDRCSFIFDVRDAASKNALPVKQKKLLRDLGVNDLSFDSVYEGQAVLANRLRSLRVLIILDDVDHPDQLDALLPHANDLRSDSLVIVTTRELRVLTSWGVSCIYKMARLSYSESQQLFCWHAFLQPFPPSGFEDLVEKFVAVCSGWPLSLKIFGAQLYGENSKDYWLSQLNIISRRLPGDIQQRLQVSYDMLDEEEKEMFLDVACFLIGEEESLAIAVWDGSGWSGLYGLETLLNKFLVELDENNRIIMQDQLRDFGRAIANRQSPYRVWLPGQIDDIQKSGERKLIRGIMAETTAYNKGITDNKYSSYETPFQKLMGISSRGRAGLRRSVGLELLGVRGNDFNKDFAQLSEDLVWLRWFEFPLRNLPSWLSLKKLRVLELFEAQYLEELWKPDAQPPLQLRELYITSGNRFKRFPGSIGQLTRLKKLTLRGDLAEQMSPISKLPEKFCDLQSLEHLELRYCTGLSSLPSGFGNLVQLRHLDLSGCQELRILPDSFNLLTHIQYLDLSGCTEISSLPSGFGNLVKLRHLDLSGCQELKMLPNSFNLLTYLQYLDLSGCTELSSLPSGFGNLVQMRHIDLSGCQELRMLPDSFNLLTYLQYLDLSGCTKLSSLPSGLGNLVQLKHLDLSGCQELSMLPDSFNLLTHLQYLNLSGCTELSSLPSGLGNLVQLRHLDLSGCQELRTLPYSFNLLTHLQYLDLSSCTELSSLPSGFENLEQLRHLNFSGCQELTTLPVSLKQLERLESFNFLGCPKLSSPPRFFENSVPLMHLSLSELRMSVSFDLLTHLKNLDLSGCVRLRPDMLENITALKILEIFRYTELKEMPLQLTHQATMKELTILESAQDYQMTNQSATRLVYVCGCTEIHQITNQTRELIVCKSIQKFRKSIGQLQQLETIVVDGCVNTSLKALPEQFSHLKGLRRLTLRWCRALTSLPRHFGNLTRLQHLDLAFCSQLKELPHSFKQLELLQHLNFEGCSNLVILPHIFGRITTLKHLNFKDCGKLRVLPTQVPYQPSLKTLNLLGTNLEELPNEVGMLNNLEVLEIGSPYLTELTVSMGNMINLKTLNVKGCPSLKCLPDSLGLLEKLSINAPQALKETLKEMVEETPNWRCVIL